MRPTWAEIDLAAYDRNLDAINARLPEGSRLIAVLKANGYGHGAVQLARRCTPDRVAMIAAVMLEEALELRTAGITVPLLVLGPVLEERDVAAAVEANITLGIPGPEELDVVARVARERDVHVHLKLDSGMGRMGVVESELPRVAEIVRATPRLRVDAIYSHLANADDAEDPFTDEQLARFRTLLATLREAGVDAPLHHIANSSATLRGLVAPGEHVRVGLALLGANAVDVAPGFSRADGLKPVPTFEPVLRWRTAIARLKELPAGHAIGYGTTFHTTRPSRIATLPVGYADGYNRRFSNLGEVLVRGKRAPVTGRVSMDLTTIDVTDIPDARIGDEVVLLGDDIRVEELARKLDTISYEVFCSISARVPRVYRNA